MLSDICEDIKQKTRFESWRLWEDCSVKQDDHKVEDTPLQDQKDAIWNYAVRCSLLQDTVSRPSYFHYCHDHLFYKVVTPSDVGKLNRLVIPKHHAERFFPLELSQRKRGLFLNFRDDSTGKLWWFRYSYWSSCQSYVLTKGWIGFVTENRLQAGDIISFGKGSHEQFYISSFRREPFRSPTVSVSEGVQTTPVQTSFTDFEEHVQLCTLYASCPRCSHNLQLLLPSGEPSSSSKTVTEVAADLSDDRTRIIPNEASHVVDRGTAVPNSLSNLRLFGVDIG